MFNPIVLLCCLILGIGYSTRVYAVAWMSGQEFVNHCRTYTESPTNNGGVICLSYIQGFLEGAEATDGVVERSVREEYKEKNTFTERAIITRLGERAKRYGATSYAQYCLESTVSIHAVVNAVIQFIDANPNHIEKGAREVVYGALMKTYPCQ